MTDDKGAERHRRLRAIDALEDAAHEAETPSAPDDDDSDRQPHRGIYLLPNLITTGALFCGFFATVAAINGRFESAAVALFAAMILDAADGRVARLTRTESAFGAEFDSLSDMVAFGVAPALVVFTWSLQSLGQFGWVATFIYMACTALRLARFNTHHDNAGFVGLASPSAAAILAGIVWAVTDSASPAAPTGFWAALLGMATIGVALLMVSPIDYWSPKLIDLKGRVPFIVLVAIVFAFAVVMVDPPRVLLTIALVYAMSGPLTWAWTRWRQRGQAPTEPPA